MTIDYRKIKAGDKIEVVVTESGQAGARGVWANGAWIPNRIIIGHTPAPKKPLKVGDIVIDESGDIVGIRITTPLRESLITKATYYETDDAGTLNIGDDDGIFLTIARGHWIAAEQIVKP